MLDNENTHERQPLHPTTPALGINGRPYSAGVLTMAHRVAAWCAGAHEYRGVDGWFYRDQDGAWKRDAGRKRIWRAVRATIEQAGREAEWTEDAALGALVASLAPISRCTAVVNACRLENVFQPRPATEGADDAV